MEEIWKDIEGFEGYYQVSNLGLVRGLDRFAKHPKGGLSLKKGKMVRFGVKPAGYLFFPLSKNGKVKLLMAHRLVALAFIPNPENKTQVNHKNGIKADNRVENLEWVTGSENQLHAFRIGLSSTKGENSRCRKLSEESVSIIRNSHGTLSGYEVAKMFGISRDHVYAIRSGKRW